MRNIPTAHVDVDRQPSYVRGRLGSQMRCMRVLGLVSGGCVSSWSLESYVARGAEENDVGMCALLARCPVCSLYAASGVIQPESCWCVHILLVRKDCGISFVSFRLPVRNVGDSQAGWHCFVSRVLLFFRLFFDPGSVCATMNTTQRCKSGIYCRRIATPNSDHERVTHHYSPGVFVYGPGRRASSWYTGHAHCGVRRGSRRRPYLRGSPHTRGLEVGPVFRRA